MKNKFTELCGERVEDMGDISTRFEAVASELFNVSCYQEYILKQAFPQTADGEFLSKHAVLRGLNRKPASKAMVRLTFSCDIMAEKRITIPKGTICSCESKPFIQFSTLYVGYINGGQKEVTVDAIALDYGEEYNVAEGMINTIVNPISKVNSVINIESAKGGVSQESDENLRKRIVNSYRNLPIGVNFASLQSTIEDIEDVTKCRIIYDVNSKCFYVYVKTKNLALYSDVYDEVFNRCAFISLFCENIDISHAIPKNIDLKIRCKREYNVDEQQCYDKICEVCNDYINSVDIGSNIDLNKLSNVLLKQAYLVDCEVVSQNRNIVLNKDEYAHINSIEVEYER